jgi:hypothetical protein
MNGYTARLRATLAAALATGSAAALIWQDVTDTGPDQLTIVTATILVVSLQVLAFPVEEIARVFGQLFGRRQ